MKNGNLPYKIRDYFLSLFFLLLITGVGAFTLATSYQPMINGVLSTYQQSIMNNESPFQQLKGLIQGFEGVLNENLYLRNYFAGIDSNVMYFQTGTLRSKQVLMGKDHWLFYKTTTDGNPIADYQGSNAFTPDEVQKIRNSLLNLQSQAAKKGATFVLMILPNKEQIYSSFMPSSISKITEMSRTDLLVDTLKESTSIPIVYPKNELMAYRDRFQLYYRFDTHWNQLGSYIGEQQLLSALNLPRGYLENQEILTSTPALNSELASMVKMNWYFNDDQEFTFPPHKNDHPIRLLFLGDSFRTALTPHLLQDFNNLLILHRNDYDPKVLEDFNPEVIVLQYVERYTGDIPEFQLTP